MKGPSPFHGPLAGGNIKQNPDIAPVWPGSGLARLGLDRLDQDNDELEIF
jgi:hypothetical protein